jgi:hypothetical protein
VWFKNRRDCEFFFPEIVRDKNKKKLALGVIQLCWQRGERMAGVKKTNVEELVVIGSDDGQRGYSL